MKHRRQAPARRRVAIGAAAMAALTTPGYASAADYPEPAGTGENANIYDGTLSDDGNRVASIVDGEGNKRSKLVVTDRAAGTTETEYMADDADLPRADLSGNGGTVAFSVHNTATSAYSLKAWNVDVENVQRMSGNFSYLSAPTVSANGRWVAFTAKREGESRENVFRWNVKDNKVTQVTDGTSITHAVISGDGRKIAYSHVGHTWLRTVADGKTELIDATADGERGNGKAYPTEVSTSGDYVLFSSTATNLATNTDACSYDDATHGCGFRRNAAQERTTPASVLPNGKTTRVSTGFMDMSNDGRVVSFSPWGQSGQANVRRMSTAETRVYSVSDKGERADAKAYAGTLDGAGSLGLFWSKASNVHADYDGSACDFYCQWLTETGV